MEKNNLELPKNFQEKIMLKQCKKMNFFCQIQLQYIYLLNQLLFSLVNKENKKIKFEI